MKKIGGYVFVLIGLAVLVFSVQSLKQYLKFLSFLNGIQNNYLMIAGVALVIVGIVLLMGRGSGRQAEEVPIYRGKNIVGYRRGR